MIKTFQILIFICLTTTIPQIIKATGQAPDLLVIKNDTFYLFSNPLETYLEFKSARTINGIELNGTGTGCWRGYIAFWKIDHDSLFLTNIIRQTDSGTPHFFSLKDEFGADNMFAEWFTGTIVSPRGNRLQYVHMGYLSVYEKEEYYRIWNGKVKSTESKNYVVFDKNLLYPGEKFLRDTLQQIVKSKLNSETIKELKDSDSCILEVHFNKSGKVENIDVGKSCENSLLGKSILSIAREAYTKLPSLMTVTHNNYLPPHFEIFFNAHCIKYPNDKAYGCKD
jgi:hypothetical protein